MKGLKTGGRTKGTPNKTCSELSDKIRNEYPDYDPVLAMCAIAANEDNDVRLRLAANKEIAQYIYPKRKSVEHSGNINDEYSNMSDVERAIRIEAILDRARERRAKSLGQDDPEGVDSDTADLNPTH